MAAARDQGVMVVVPDQVRTTPRSALTEIAQTVTRVLPFGGLVGAAALLGLLKGLVYAKALGSEDLGRYSLVVLLATYIELACHWGSYRGLECFLPTLYGSGRAAQAEALRNRVAGFVAQATGIAVIVAALAPWWLPDFASVDASAIVLATLFIGSAVLLALPMQDIRSRRGATLLGRAMFAKALGSLVAGGVAMLAFGWRGAVMGEIAVNAVLFVVLARWQCTNFRIRRSGAGLSEVVRSGVPLSLKGIVSDFSLTLDRWCVLSVAGLAAFGQYMFAAMLVTASLVIHNAVWVYFGPRVAYAYGADHDVSAMCRRLTRLTLALLALFVVGFLPFSAAVAWGVPRFFPEYEEGGRLLQILYWGACFQVLAQYEWALMTLQRAGLLFVATLAATAVTMLLYALGVTGGWSLMAFAGVFVAGRGLTVVAQIIAAWVAVRQARQTGVVMTSTAA